MSKNITPSPETKQEALKVANATQRPGQSKEQTKLIAQGIEKGIALYKKQQKERQRSADKERKKVQKQKESSKEEVSQDSEIVTTSSPSTSSSILPWSLLVISWVAFAAYLLLQK
ncbi:DUF2956 domain-containing protein [Vibrio sp.]|nr:DUF2956 domain-containing protein [Vibrio sp.]